MSGMIVEMVLKLIDQLSAPMGTATQSLEEFRAGIGETKVKASDFFESFNKQAASLGELQGRIEKLQSTAANLSISSYAAKSVGQSFEELGKPIEEATNAAMEFEKRIESIARAGGRLGMEGKIGDSIMDAARASNVPWQQLAEGERHLVALGGGEYLDKISGVRERIAKLVYASEADAKELYSLIERYMKVGHLSAEQAVGMLERNYVQGKKGAFELKDLARFMPELYSAAMSIGATGSQAATDIPAVLQILRQLAGTPGNAGTMMKQGLKHLTDPSDLKRIEAELGVDVNAVRGQAVASGQDPVLAIAGAIADKLSSVGAAAGKVDPNSGQVVGADPEKLGAIAREYNFRMFIDAFAKMRDQLKDFDVSGPEASKQVMEDFNSRMNTAAGSADRLAAAHERAAISIAKSELEWTRSTADLKTKMWDALTSAEKTAPGLTHTAVGAWSGLSHIGSFLGDNVGTALQFAGMWALLKSFGLRFPAVGAIGETIAGIGKSAVTLPWDLGKGAIDGVKAGAAGLPEGVAKLGALFRWFAPFAMAWGAVEAGRGGVMDFHKWREERGAKGVDLDERQKAFKEELQHWQLAPAPGAPAQGAPEAQSAQPKVDTTQIDTAKEKAASAGDEIKKSLDVTASPKVETAGIAAALAMARELATVLTSIGAQGKATAASVARGAGALHDGYETQ